MILTVYFVSDRQTDRSLRRIPNQSGRYITVLLFSCWALIKLKRRARMDPNMHRRRPRPRNSRSTPPTAHGHKIRERGPESRGSRHPIGVAGGGVPVRPGRGVGGAPSTVCGHLILLERDRFTVFVVLCRVRRPYLQGTSAVGIPSVKRH